MPAKNFKFSATSHPKPNYPYKKQENGSFVVKPDAKPTSPSKVTWPKNFAR